MRILGWLFAMLTAAGAVLTVAMHPMPGRLSSIELRRLVERLVEAAQRPTSDIGARLVLVEEALRARVTGLRSLATGQKRLETPHLAIKYQPTDWPFATDAVPMVIKR